MFKDKDGVEISVGSQILKDGHLFVIIDFVDYGMALEAVCEDKLSHQIYSFQPDEILKI